MYSVCIQKSARGKGGELLNRLNWTEIFQRKLAMKVLPLIKNN
jgi:hypothetical protein